MSSSGMEPFLLEDSDLTSQGNRSFQIVYGYVEGGRGYPLAGRAVGAARRMISSLRSDESGGAALENL